MSNASRKRKVISLATKIDVLDKLDQGAKVNEVAKCFNLHEATVRTIRGNAEAILSTVVVGNSAHQSKTSRCRPPIMEKMEKSLDIWIRDCGRKRIPLDSRTVRDKALQVYYYLIETGEVPTDPVFQSSQGWFDKFCKRNNFHNVTSLGEAASSADEKDGNEDNGSDPLSCEDKEEDLSPKEISLKDVREGIRLVSELRDHFRQCDPNDERLSKFDMLLNDATKPYQELMMDLASKIQQPKLDIV